MDAATLIERRALRRKLTFWRVAALLGVMGIAVAIVMASSGETGLVPSGDQIARIAIEGTILEDKDLIERIRDAGDNDAVKAIILTVDSPGGTTVGGEAIHEAVKNAAKMKPVVAEVGTLAASAGYMVASAANHIVARQSSLIGSIGVIIQGPNVSRALDKLGIDVETYKSAPLKAEPSPFNTTTPEERAAIDAVIADSYAWFIDLVAQNRAMPIARVRDLASGAIFTGRQAKTLGLIDALGGESVVLDYLASKGIDRELPIVDLKPTQDFASRLMGGTLGVRQQGLSALIGQLNLDPLFLDGLVSVWQVHPNVTTP